MQSDAFPRDYCTIDKAKTLHFFAKLGVSLKGLYGDIWRFGIRVEGSKKNNNTGQYRDNGTES